MEIKIRSIQIIKPLKPTLENQCSFKLSLFDQLAAFSNIDLILYYKPSCEVNIADRCTHLVKSLSEVLCSYYPLAGIVKEDGLEIDCCDQGVKYLETRVTTTLDNFIKKGPKIDNTRRLVGAPDQATTTLVTIQVNVFDCGALAIGVSALHKVTDTCNLIRFINEWAGINRTGGSTGAFCPSFDNLAFPPMEVPLSNYPPIPSAPYPPIRYYCKRIKPKFIDLVVLKEIYKQEAQLCGFPKASSKVYANRTNKHVQVEPYRASVLDTIEMEKIKDAKMTQNRA
ncbi:acetyl-CoA-benzylalcohol acetyltransferase-like protein, partial [Tanacetum coccineum]